MILVDTSEPDNIKRYLSQMLPMQVDSLNQKSMADYWFTSVEGRRIQVNRTQAGELLGNIDSFEDELRRYYNSADETFAIVEGIISPYRLTGAKVAMAITTKPIAPPGSLFAYSVTDKGFIYTERVYQVSNKMLKAWLLNIDHAGISVIYTINDMDTAATLAAMYENQQKTEHTTLQRYIKPRITIRSHNPHVQALVNLSQAYKLDIGEVKAEALIDYFNNLENILLAEKSELMVVGGIGPTIAQKLKDSLGVIYES
jgi:hypothetical protein